MALKKYVERLLGGQLTFLRDIDWTFDGGGTLTESGTTLTLDGMTFVQTGAQQTFGEDGTGYDFTIYSDTAGSYFQYDADTSKLHLVGAASLLHVGTKADLHGSGVTLEATDDWGAVRIFTDDNNVNVAKNVRALQSRTLLTKDQDGGSIRAIQGQFKLLNGIDVAGGVYAPIQSYIEFAGSHSVSSGAKLAAFDASIEIASGKTVTVANGGLLAGYRAETTGSGTLTDTGTKAAAFMVSNPASAPAWTYGLYIESSDVTTGINIGTCTDGILIGTCTDGITITGATGYALDVVTSGQVRIGQQGTGIPTATATPFAVEVHAENAADIEAGLTGLTCGIRCRYEVSTAQTSQISYTAIEGRLRPKANMADGVHSGVSGTIESDGAITYTGAAQRTAGNFCVELGSTCVFTDATGSVCGVTIDSSIHATQTDITNVTLAGLRIKKSSGKLAWTHGIYLDASGATTGITLNACTTGIALSGVQTNAIVITTTGSTATDGHCLKIGSSGTPITTATSATSAVKVYSDCTHASGYHVGGWFTSQLTGNGYTSIYALRGHVDIKGGITASGAAAYYVGVHGRARVTGIINSGSHTVAGVLAQLLANGTWTAVGNACCLWVDNQLATNPTAGTVSLVWLSNNNNSGSAIVDNVFKVYGPHVPNLFSLDTCDESGGFVSATSATAHGGTLKRLHILIGSTDYYLLASTEPA